MFELKNTKTKQVFPTLYKKTHTGAIQFWRANTEDNQVIVTYGQVGGKEVTSIKECEGKNIGKANETNSYQQAVNEAHSLWKKKIEREQYKTKVEDCDDIKVAPMLAQDINKNWKVIEKEFSNGAMVAVSRKLDGNRLIVHVKEDESIEYYSRKLVAISTLDHLNISILDFVKSNRLPLPIYLDGEAYIHGESLQTINSLLKKKQTGTDRIKYNIYDCYFPEEPFLDFQGRFINRVLIDDYAVNVVESYFCSTIQEIDTFLSTFEEEGYEGAMVRILMVPYDIGHRSKALLKYKRFEDAEFQIIDYKYGKDSFKNCVLWVCKTPEGEEFDILASGSLEEKAIEDPKQHLGKFLTIKFKGKTDKGIPKFGTVKGFREDF